MTDSETRVRYQYASSVKLLLGPRGIYCPIKYTYTMQHYDTRYTDFDKHQPIFLYIIIHTLTDLETTDARYQ